MNSLKTGVMSVWLRWVYSPKVKMIQLAGPLMVPKVYASAVPLPLDEESDLDMYAAQGDLDAELVWW